MALFDPNLPFDPMLDIQEPGNLAQVLIDDERPDEADDHYGCPSCNRSRPAFMMVDVREDGRWPFGFVCSTCYKGAIRRLRYFYRKVLGVAPSTPTPTEEV